MENNRKKTRRAKVLIAFGLFVLFILLALFLFSGDEFEILKIILTQDHDAEELQDLLGEFGIKGYVTVTVLSMLQVMFPFLPAEPVQVISGVSFGFPIGLLCCTVGVIFGNLCIYFIYKIYGNRVEAFFVKNIHLDFDKTASSRKLVIIIFVLYFLPAIPYGMICFIAASLKMKLPRYMTVTVLGSIPSI